MKKLYLFLIVILILNSLPVSVVHGETTYPVTKLSVGDFLYNPNTKILTATAELVTTSSSASTGETAPASGTIVLAAYRSGQLIGVNTSEYTNLTEANPYEISLKLDSVNGVIVKAFIVDSFSSLTPLTIAKQSTDVTELIVYDDVIIYDEQILKAYYNFEDDVMVYDEQVDSFEMELLPGEAANLVGVISAEDGNNYLSVRTSDESTKHPFAVLSCNNLNKLIVEFDFASPGFSRASFVLYDSDGNSATVLTSDTSGSLKCGRNTVGSLKSDGWVRIKLVINNEDKLCNIYVDDAHTGEDIPFGSALSNIGSMRIWGRCGYGDSELMFDNIVVYSGNTLYDFSKTLSGVPDENVTIYNHNDAGVEELLKSYNAIHTVTGKLYIDSMDTVTKMPYWQNGVLYVALPDAEKLVFGRSSSLSEDYVALENFADENGKKLTYNATNTILVGDKTAILSDKMIKYLNAYMTYDRPSAQALESAFSGQRPRLTLSEQKLTDIKHAYTNGSDKYITSWCNNIISDANKYLNLPVKTFVEPIGMAGRLHVVAGDIKEMVQKLALAYHLTQDSTYAERAWAEIENACCTFPHWHQGIHELDAAGMASAVAYGYDWLYDYWHETDSSRLAVMENALYSNKLDWSYEAYHASRPYSWAVTSNNWNAICNGYTALAACAIYESNPHKCADIISNAILNSESALSEFYPDGAWKEGTGYWVDTVAGYTELFTTVKNIFGSYYNLENTALLDVTADFIILSAGPVGNNNYNDSPYQTYSTRSVMHWFANMYNNPSIASARLGEIDRGIATAGVFDLCYYDPDLTQSEVSFPLDSYFEHLELVSLRSSWTNPEGAYISLHSGNNLNADAHSHIDSGTFVIDMLGERIAHDPGSHYYYTEGHGLAPDIQPEDDGSAITRWDYYHHVPEGHNCFVINPDMTIGQNIVTDDKIEEFESSSDCAYAITSLNTAYEGYAKNAKRGIMLSDNRQSVTIRDEIELNPGDNEIYWFMHKATDSTIEKIDDRTYIMTQNGKKVKIMFVTNADSAVVYEADPVHLVRTPPPEQEAITHLNKLVIKMTASENVYLQVKFIPLDSEYSNVPINNLSLDNWNIN